MFTLITHLFQNKNLEVEMANLVLNAHVVCLFITYLAATTPPPTWTSTTIPEQCDEGWVSFDDHCYRIVMESKNRTGAAIYCMGEGSYLVEIDTDDEYDFVKNDLLSDHSEESFWIGATYNVIEEKFQYEVSGQQVQSHYWMFGEPNGMRKEECVGMMVDFVGLGLYDRICSLNDYFVCEKT